MEIIMVATMNISKSDRKLFDMFAYDCTWAMSDIRDMALNMPLSDIFAMNEIPLCT